jgi:hypothetical protein
VSDWIEDDGKKYFEESYLQMANANAKRLRSQVEELQRELQEARKMHDASDIPVGWRYRVLVNKHSSGPPLQGEIPMLDICRQRVWGSPGEWRYSDGPDAPDVDWMCDAEPLYAAAAHDAAIRAEAEAALQRVASHGVAGDWYCAKCGNNLKDWIKAGMRGPIPKPCVLCEFGLKDSAEVKRG